MNPDPTISEPDEPYPPRYWWLKRLSIVFGVWAVAVCALIWLWYAAAGWMLDREIQSILQTSPADAPTADPSVPDEINAVATLFAAVKAIPPLAPGLFDDYIPTPGWPDEDVSGDARLAAADQSVTARELARRARSQDAVDWSKFSAPPTGIHPWLDLINVLSAAASCEHMRGNDAEAVEIIRDMVSMLHRAERAGAPDSLDEEFTDRPILSAWAMLNVLNIQSRSTAATRSTAASRRQIEQLIDELSQAGAIGERGRISPLITQWSLAEQFADPVRRAALRSWPGFRPPPLLELEVRRRLRLLTRATTYYQAGDTAATAALWDRELNQPHAHLTYVAHVTGEGFSHVQRMYNLQAERFAQRRALAVALAIRLYELDHDRPPNDLKDLIPDYISTLPADPFSREGKGFRYQTAPLMLYSVGSNGRDDGGTPSLPPHYPSMRQEDLNLGHDMTRWFRQDAVFLIRWPAPTSQPSLIPKN